MKYSYNLLEIFVTIFHILKNLQSVHILKIELFINYKHYLFAPYIGKILTKKEIFMNSLHTHITNYLSFCKSQKCLDDKTLKAYRIDLTQFSKQLNTQDISGISIEILESFIATLHQNYKPKTAKRKIASIKAFYHYLEYRDIILINPFNKMHFRFREPVLLPKTIPLHVVECFLKTIYNYHATANTPFQQLKTLQDIAIIELLFATGIRISELCLLKASNVNLFDNTILIFGKGSKERRI